MAFITEDGSGKTLLSSALSPFFDQKKIKHRRDQ